MKKIKEIKGFKYLYLYRNSIIVQNEDSLQQIDEYTNSNLLLKGNIYSVNILEGELFYQLEDELGLYLFNKGLVLNKDSFYGLLSALKCGPYIYIYREYIDSEVNTPLFFSFDFQYINNAPEYCNFSYKEYLIRNSNRKKIFNCYQINNKLWNYNHYDDSNIEIISGYKDKILVYSESGDLFALSLQAGELCWEYPEKCSYGRYSFYDNFIYHMYKNEFREICADTGNLLRIGDISDLRKRENYFAASAGIKVYDDYIFARDADGAIAIIDRRTLALKEVLQFDKHLMNNDSALQWVNKRLYVQDIEYTIHIFE